MSRFTIRGIHIFARRDPRDNSITRETRGQNYLVKTLSRNEDEKHGINLVRYIYIYTYIFASWLELHSFLFTVETQISMQISPALFSQSLFPSTWEKLFCTVIYRSTAGKQTLDDETAWPRKPVARPETKSSYRAADNFTGKSDSSPPPRLCPSPSPLPSFPPIVFVYVYLITRWIMMAKMKRKICN